MAREFASQEEFEAALESMAPADDGERKRLACFLLGHSNILDGFFGYMHCARCGDQVGDCLGSTYTNPDAVLVGHKCSDCIANYARMGWRDKVMCPDPMAEQEVSA